MKKIVLKVIISCSKCKVCIMTTISKFNGVVSISLDAEKSTVTIVGDVDAVVLVRALRKGKTRPVEVVSVGDQDDKKEEKEKKKNEKKQPDCCKSLPSCCGACNATTGVWQWQAEPYLPCTIL